MNSFQQEWRCDIVLPNKESRANILQSPSLLETFFSLGCLSVSVGNFFPEEEPGELFNK